MKCTHELNVTFQSSQFSYKNIVAMLFWKYYILASDSRGGCISPIFSMRLWRITGHHSNSSPHESRYSPFLFKTV